jgi:hypothetical protein
MLISPGVEVNVIVDTYSGETGPGTVPLVILATASNKLTPSGTGIAPLTQTANSGKLQLVTSQRDIAAQLGNPLFYSNQGTPLHGFELNEYGAQALWDIVAAQNLCYFVRAPIDLAALAPRRTAPTAPPANGTFWFDYNDSSMGVFVSNGNASTGAAWTNVQTTFTTATDVDVSFIPLTGFGANGDYTIVTQNSSNLLFQKVGGTWLKVGSTAWKTAHPTVITGTATPITATGTIVINGTTVTLSSASVSTAAANINSAAITNVTAAAVNGALVLTHSTGGNLVLSGSALTTLGFAANTYKGVSLVFTNDASFPANSVAGDIWIKMTAPAKGTSWVLKSYNSNTASWVSVNLKIFAFNSTLTDGDAGKDTAAVTGFAGTLTTGSIYLGYDAATGARELRVYNGTNFVVIGYEATLTAPTLPAAEDALWFSPDHTVDIMYGDGLNWRGYGNIVTGSDPKGVIVDGSAPTLQSDGTALVDGDIWLNSTNLETYPDLYRYNAATGRWISIDNTDQTTPYGIVFADARSDSGVAFTGQLVTGYGYSSVLPVDLVLSDYVDPDAPDARHYPAGTLLFNTRASTYNVKQWKPHWFVDGNFDATTNYTAHSYSVGDTRFVFPALVKSGRWLTVSGNKSDGSPYMGRKAQRAMVVRSMQAALAGAEEIRSNAYNFTLLAAPGYPELNEDLIALNADRGETLTILTDVPARIAPNQVEAWKLNAKRVGENGDDGLVSADPYMAIYYGWGLSNDSTGSNIMIPPSSIALRTILYNDQVAQVWFAPAGDTRGVVFNAQSIGYLSSEGEYVPLALNRAQENVLYSNQINPIVSTPGRGLRVMGQKTTSPVAGPLDRVQGVRLANYLRVVLAAAARPFVMEQNDAQTRAVAKITMEKILNSLITLRAIDDYAVLCDASNNTEARRARKELWIDIAVQPIFAAEFIYIPCRFKDGLNGL